MLVAPELIPEEAGNTIWTESAEPALQSLTNPIASPAEAIAVPVTPCGNPYWLKGKTRRK